ncbi:hypothetical protein WDW86_08750 [Bdellovibrionota bacterium FG-2]
MLKLQKPGALKLTQDAEVIVSLLKSEHIRNKFPIQVAAILENVAATNIQCYRDLLIEIPDLASAPVVPPTADLNNLCRTPDEVKMLTATLTNTTEKIMHLFNPDGRQMTQALNPLAGRFGKVDSPEAQSWLKSIVANLLAESEAGTGLLVYGKAPLPFVRDWAQSVLFHITPPERSEVIYILKDDLLPVILDN